MGENWKDPTTAGALSRWILWGKPSLRESFNDYKKRFNIEGVMAVTNTRMNPKDCPPATQDLKLNTKNRDSAIAAEHIQYGPLNLSDEDYWVRYGKKWNTSGEIAKNSNCGNCVAFDTSPRMEDCMPLELDKDGRLGYCWMHHFKCHSARTCYTWAAGGPITNDKQSMDNQARAFSKPNPKAPGYNSYAWTTQDWRSIKVNNKGEVDYSKKCGAEDTQVADGTPRLCLPAEVVRTLMKSKNGKEILLTQARKKARAAKGTRIPWHPRIKEIWKRVEDKTVEDRANPPIPFGPRPNPAWRHGKAMSEEEDPFASMFNPPIAYDRDGKPHMLPSEEAVDMVTIQESLREEESPTIAKPPSIESESEDEFGEPIDDQFSKSLAALEALLAETQSAPKVLGYHESRALNRSQGELNRERWSV